MNTGQALPAGCWDSSGSMGVEDRACGLPLQTIVNTSRQLWISWSLQLPDQPPLMPFCHTCKVATMAPSTAIFQSSLC
jgi:hypothetical protein